jgi:hypothetical protein
LYLPISWSKERLIEVLDARINHLVRQTYTNQVVTHRDLLPKQIGKQPTIDYMIDRTLMRPRDIIQFFNYCICKATDNPVISVKMIHEAEGEYSRGRLRSLGDEWSAHYPNLLAFTNILQNRSPVFCVSDIEDDECEEYCLQMAMQRFERTDELSTAALQAAEAKLPVDEFRRLLIKVFYKVGLVGLKLSSLEKITWSFHQRHCVTMAEIQLDTRVRIHPFAWRALRIVQPKDSE